MQEGSSKWNPLTDHLSKESEAVTGLATMNSECRTLAAVL